tara:strand:- start:283 stop:486 length:204 start_codon:yes stop_codon:yes gene_type:complete
MSGSVFEKIVEEFNDPQFTEEQLVFLFSKFPACMGHLVFVVMENKTKEGGYNWRDFYENDLPLKEGN